MYLKYHILTFDYLVRGLARHSVHLTVTLMDKLLQHAFEYIRPPPLRKKMHLAQLSNGVGC